MDDNKEYIGDGVYVEYDGYGITLYTDRSGVRHWVYLEPAAMSALTIFAKSKMEGKS